MLITAAVPEILYIWSWHETELYHATVSHPGDFRRSDRLEVVLCLHKNTEIADSFIGIRGFRDQRTGDMLATSVHVIRYPERGRERRILHDRQIPVFADPVPVFTINGLQPDFADDLIEAGSGYFHKIVMDSVVDT